MISSIAFGLFGLAVLISVAYALSGNKKSIDWRQISAGVGLQIVFAILALFRHQACQQRLEARQVRG